MHSTLMTVMGVIFFLGANGGLVLSLVQVCACARMCMRVRLSGVSDREGGRQAAGGCERKGEGEGESARARVC